MNLQPRRLATQTLVISGALAWGVVEFMALMRQRWVRRRRH